MAVVYAGRSYATAQPAGIQLRVYERTSRRQLLSTKGHCLLCRGALTEADLVKNVDAALVQLVREAQRTDTECVALYATSSHRQSDPGIWRTVPPLASATKLGSTAT